MVSILQEAREAPNGNSCSGSCNSFYPLEARGPVWQYCSWKCEDELRAPCLDEWWCNYRVGTDLGSLLIRVGCRIRAGIVKFCPKSSECLGAGGHQRREDSPVSWWRPKVDGWGQIIPKSLISNFLQHATAVLIQVACKHGANCRLRIRKKPRPFSEQIWEFVKKKNQ